MPRKKTTEEITESFNKGIYSVIMFPSFFGFIGLFAPRWSPVYALIWACMMVLLIAWNIYGHIKKRHQDQRWRGLYYVIHWDITAFLMLIPFWRTLGEQAWLLVLFIVLYIICILITHRYRYTIAEGVHFHPRSKFGKTFYTIAFIVVVLSGGGTYGLSRSLQVFFGENTASVVLSGLMLPFAFIFIIAFC